MRLENVEFGTIGVARAALLDRAEESSTCARLLVEEAKAELAGAYAKLSAMYGNAYLSLKEARFL